MPDNYKGECVWASSGKGVVAMLPNHASRSSSRLGRRTLSPALQNLCHYMVMRQEADQAGQSAQMAFGELERERAEKAELARQLQDQQAAATQALEEEAGEIRIQMEQSTAQHTVQLEEARRHADAAEQRGRELAEQLEGERALRSHAAEQAAVAVRAAASAQGALADVQAAARESRRRAASPVRRAKTAATGRRLGDSSGDGKSAAELQVELDSLYQLFLAAPKEMVASCVAGARQQAQLTAAMALTGGQDDEAARNAIRAAAAAVSSSADEAADVTVLRQQLTAVSRRHQAATRELREMRLDREAEAALSLYQSGGEHSGGGAEHAAVLAVKEKVEALQKQAAAARAELVAERTKGAAGERVLRRQHEEAQAAAEERARRAAEQHKAAAEEVQGLRSQVDTLALRQKRLEGGDLVADMEAAKAECKAAKGKQFATARLLQRERAELEQARRSLHQLQVHVRYSELEISGEETKAAKAHLWERYELMNANMKLKQQNRLLMRRWINAQHPEGGAELDISYAKAEGSRFDVDAELSVGSGGNAMREARAALEAELEELQNMPVAEMQELQRQLTLTQHLLKRAKSEIMVTTKTAVFATWRDKLRAAVQQRETAAREEADRKAAEQLAIAEDLAERLEAEEATSDRQRLELLDRDALLVKMERELEKLGVGKDALAAMKDGVAPEDKDAIIKTLRRTLHEKEHELSVRYQLVKAMHYQRRKADETKAEAKVIATKAKGDVERAERHAAARETKAYAAMKKAQVNEDRWEIKWGAARAEAEEHARDAAELRAKAAEVQRAMEEEADAKVRAAEARTAQALRDLSGVRATAEAAAKEVAALKEPISKQHEEQFHGKWRAVGTVAKKARKAIGFFGKKKKKNLDHALVRLVVPMSSGEKASMPTALDSLMHVLIQGADPNAKCNEKGMPALHHATLHGHVDVVMALLAAGADAHAKHGGRTPLDVAGDQPDIAAALRRHMHSV